MLNLKHCSIAFTSEGCTVRFPDGTETNAHPHWSNPHYTVIAHRTGYADDLLGFCQEHELAHALTQEWLHDRPSPVLWGAAHGSLLTGRQSAEEEQFAQTFQRFVRAGERPIVSGLPKLDEWKRQFLGQVAVLRN